MHANSNSASWARRYGNIKIQADCTKRRVRSNLGTSKRNSYERSASIRKTVGRDRTVILPTSRSRQFRKVVESARSFAKQLLRFIIQIIIVTVATSPVTYLSIKEAYETRGYFAVGGEWILSISLIVFIMWILRGKRERGHGK